MNRGFTFQVQELGSVDHDGYLGSTEGTSTGVTGGVITEASEGGEDRVSLRPNSRDRVSSIVVHTRASFRLARVELGLFGA